MIIILKLKMQKVFGIWYLKYQIPYPQDVFSKVFKCSQINMYLVFYLNASFWVFDPILPSWSGISERWRYDVCMVSWWCAWRHKAAAAVSLMYWRLIGVYHQLSYKNQTGLWRWTWLGLLHECTQHIKAFIGQSLRATIVRARHELLLTRSI